MIETIITGIIALGVLVFAHELGHFLAAKKSGIRVEQFSIGFWPRIFGVTRGGTDYRISAIPFGGYVKMAGMSYEDEDRTGAPDEFLSKPAWIRAFVAVAGPAMNFVLAAILCAAMGMIGYTVEDYPAVLGKIEDESTASRLGLREGDALVEVNGTAVSTWYGLADVVDAAESQREVSVKINRDEETIVLGIQTEDLRDVLSETSPRNPPVVGQVLIGYPAYRAGLTAGDSIVAVNGQEVNDWSDLQATISSNPDSPVNFDIIRDEGRFSVEIVPMAVRQRSGESVGRVGISPVQVGRYAVKLPLVESVKQGPVIAIGLAGQIYKNLWTLVTNITTLSKSLVGPIGIVQMTGGEARKGLANYMYWGAFVSVALMVFNLLPIPVLDGGHIFLSGIEGLIRRRLKPRVHILVHRVGMGILGALVVFVVVNDLYRLWSRDRAVSRTQTEAVESGEVGPGGWAVSYSEDRLLKDLNDPQRQAVTHGDGPLLILAGAGSGKTRVLTYRIAHLVGARGVDPSRVLAFTFTNKAAEEMRGRVEHLIGVRAGMWIGTFHGTCARILRSEAPKLGFDRSFSIYDESDQQDLVREILKAGGISEKEFRPAAVLEKISACKNALVSPEEYRETALSRYDSQAAELYERYQKLLKARNAMDFDDLICRTLELFTVDPNVGGFYRERFDHVLVDEYQDTDHAQFKLVEALAVEHRNLFVVGDDDQSIYGWRGADVRNILSFQESFPDAEVVRLEQNYRSTGLILAAASAVVKNNSSRMKKTLWTEAAPGFRLTLDMAQDEADEAGGVVETIRDISRSEGREWAEFGVLFRTNAQSRALETAFKREGIPYHLVGGTAFYQRREVKDLLAYLRCISNPLDDVSFRRTVDAPPRGAGRTSLDRLELHCRSSGTSLEEAARNASQVEGVSPGAVRALADLTGALTRWREAKESLPLGALLEDIIDTTGYLDRLHQEEGGSGGTREENVLELVATCCHFAETREDPSLDAFVCEAALMTSVDRWDPSRSAVTLMTAHNAKGLEFNVVFLVGLEDGLFPHLSSLDDRDRLEEERRLFYVGITRAKQRVSCWAAARRRRGRTYMDGTLSRFLGEIPSELIEMRANGREGAGRRAEFNAFEPGSAIGGPEGPGSRLNRWPVVGDRVYHSTFGWGLVTDKVHGSTPRCTVQFEDAGARRILTKYLKRDD